MPLANHANHQSIRSQYLCASVELLEDLLARTWKVAFHIGVKCTITKGNNGPSSKRGGMMLPLHMIWIGGMLTVRVCRKGDMAVISTRLPIRSPSQAWVPNTSIHCWIEWMVPGAFDAFALLLALPTVSMIHHTIGVAILFAGVEEDVGSFINGTLLAAILVEAEFVEALIVVTRQSLVMKCSVLNVETEQCRCPDLGLGASRFNLCN